MSKYIEDGDVFETNSSGDIVIDQYKNYYDITVIFLDDQRHKKVNGDMVLSGAVFNRYKRTYFGRGFLGEGVYSTKDKKAFSCWRNMLKRCYNKELPDYIYYADVDVCEEFLDFQRFANWYYDNHVSGWQLDKDLLCAVDKRLYSPDTCIFLPVEVNTLMTNKTKITETPMGISYDKSRGVYRGYFKKDGKRVLLGSGKDYKVILPKYIDLKHKHIEELHLKYKNRVPDEVFHNIKNKFDKYIMEYC